VQRVTDLFVRVPLGGAGALLGVLRGGAGPVAVGLGLPLGLGGPVGRGDRLLGWTAWSSED